MVGIIRYLPYWPLAAARVAVVGGLVRSWRAVGSNPIPLTINHTSSGTLCTIPVVMEG